MPELSFATKGGLFAGGISFISNLASNYVNAKTASMLADTYRSQARLTMIQAEQQNAYLNEAAAQEVWNIGQDRDALIGSQYAAMGASGFDVSTGDQRLVQDTRNKADAAISGINRSMYLQAFENTKQAMLEANRLEYAAKSQELIRKQNSGLNSVISALSSGSLSALGAYYSLKMPTGSAKNVNVKGFLG